MTAPLGLDLGRFVDIAHMFWSTQPGYPFPVAASGQSLGSLMFFMHFATPLWHSLNVLR